MEKQIQLYSIDTKAFYTKKENRVNKWIMDLSIQNKNIEEYIILSYLFPDKFKCSEFSTFYKNKIRYNELDFNYELKKDNMFEYEALKCYFTILDKYMSNAKKNKVLKTYKSLLKDKKIKELLKDNPKDRNSLSKLNRLYNRNKRRLNKFKYKILPKLFYTQKEIVRVLNTDLLQYTDLKTGEIKVRQSNIISEFESNLTRTLGLKNDNLTELLFVVDVIHYEVLDQLITNGFDHRQEHYLCFTASAGQTRVKKVVFIKEKTLQEYSNTIMCGLSVDKINSYGGVNITKYLAYLSLCMSSTDKWEDFDIDRAIVVEDFETDVIGEFDFIDNKTFDIIRVKRIKEEKIKINHSDGAGLIISNKSKKPFQFRLPWFKGLLIPVPTLDYCKKVDNYKIKDIYGKEWDLKEDKILYIFSKSQFKMFNFYKNEEDEEKNIVRYGWDIYKECFKNFNCHASKSNESPDIFNNKPINYQMLQTLIDMNDIEIDKLIKPSIDYINDAHKNINSMLNIFGVNDGNTNPNYLQQILKLYPEILRDNHFQKTLKETVNSKNKDFKSGKIKINAKRTFIAPDVYAWMQWLIGRRDDNDKLITGGTPEGLIIKGDVYCSLFKKEEVLDCLRSPHLYFEHAIRNNLAAIEKDNEEYSKWFCTNCLYTSTHDLVSKLLQFDVDGDEAYVVADETIISCASKMIEKYNFRPLNYDMAKANAEKINSKNIYNSLTAAYKFSNIGINSNRITKLWNKKKINQKDIEYIAKLCMINNFQIDAAKTKFVPKQTFEIKALMNYINLLNKPYFFQFAKDEDNVDELNYKIILGEHKGKNGYIKKTIKDKSKKKDKAVFVLEDNTEMLIDRSALELNESIVNRICSKFENNRCNYNFSGIGKFDYKKLMFNYEIEIDDAVIKTYKNLDKQKNKWFMNSGLDKNDIAHGIYIRLREELLDAHKNYTIEEIVDMLIKYLFLNNKHNKKTSLFECFGNIIVSNLEINIKRKISDGYFYCNRCNKKNKLNSPTQLYCEECAKELRKERDRIRKKK